jgi:hypothetical protein
MMRGVSTFCSLCLALGLTTAVAGAQKDSATGDPAEAVRTAFPQVLKDLDSQEFEVRRHAAGVVEQWLDQPESARVLGAEFQRVLVDPAVSFEVRWQVERWARRLPDVRRDRPQAVSAEELDRLIAQLDDDSYAVRLGAMRRVAWFLQNPKLACAVMIRLKRVMDSPGLSAEARRQIDPLWKEARGAWLTSDPASWKLPPVGDEQIGHWIEELVQPTQEHGEVRAERELLDLLARDDYVERVRRMLEARLAATLTPVAAARLREVYDWTRPAMVAEFWQRRQHLGEQHLMVGEPSLAQGAMRASHFDRIDDHVAHCASGNSLTPGEYPVHVAFPHPVAEDAFFHLVNLPTPRRRMAYSYDVERDPAQRLAEISRRTLDAVLAQKRTLEPREVAMLAQLDAREVSRFAGQYFNLVPDEPNLSYRSGRQPGALEHASHHNGICALLAVEGTKEAIPGLLEAIEKHRFLEPTTTPPCRFPWWAALSIARRDPWPGVDAWLLALVGRTDLLIDGDDDGPELGATAAGLLMSRCEDHPPRLGLSPCTTSITGPLATLDPFRFESPEARARFQQWWTKEGCRCLEQRQNAAPSHQDHSNDSPSLIHNDPTKEKGSK